MAARVVPFSDLSNSLRSEELKRENDTFGKKVNELINLANKGFDVAESFIVTTDAFLDFLDQNNLKQKAEHLISIGIPHHIDKHINEAQLSKALIKEILKEYKKFGTVLEDVEITVNGEKTLGENSLIEKIRQAFISAFKDNANPTITVQKVHFGKHGKIRTSSKYINTTDYFSPAEIKKIEEMLSKFRSLFYIPHEIDFTIERGRVIINKIKPETHIALSQFDNLEPDYKIIKNSAI